MRLHASKDQIEALIFGKFGNHRSNFKRIFFEVVIISDMRATITAHSQRFLHHFFDPVRPDTEDSKICITNLTLKLHRLLDSIFVIFVHPPGEIGAFVPVTFAIQLKPRLHIWNLLDAYENFHRFPPLKFCCSIRKSRYLVKKTGGRRT